MKTLKIKGTSLRTYGKGQEKSMLKISHHAEASPHTVARYISDKGAEDLQRIDLPTFTGIFLEGFEISPEEFMQLRLKDLFDLIELP